MSKHRKTKLPKKGQVWIWREKGRKTELLTVTRVKEFDSNPAILVQSNMNPGIDIWMTVQTLRKYATAR